MPAYSLTTPTPVAVGATVPYNNAISRGGCSVTHRPGSGIIKLRGGSFCNPRKFKVHFHGNVRGLVGTIQLGLFLDGEFLPETLMSVVPGGAADVWSVDTETEIVTDCGCDALTARVITGATVTVDSAVIVIDREA